MISSEVIVRSWWNLPSFFVGEYPPSLGIVALKSRCHMPLDCGTQGKNSRARYGTLMGKSSVNGDSNGKIICKSHLDGVETSIVLPVVPWNSMLMNQIGSCFRWVEMTNHLQYIFHEKKTPCFPDSFGVWKRGQPPLDGHWIGKMSTINWSWGYFTHFLMDYKDNKHIHHYKSIEILNSNTNLYK